MTKSRKFFISAKFSTEDLNQLFKNVGEKKQPGAGSVHEIAMVVDYLVMQKIGFVSNKTVTGARKKARFGWFSFKSADGKLLKKKKDARNMV